MNEKPKRNKIISWTINIKWDNGTYENISDMDDDVSQPIDNFLTELEDESKEMQLTDSQIAVFKMLRYQKKVFIEGCAGTGKTIMAVQRAKEFAKDNKKVLILTHSRTLPINIRKKYFNLGWQYKLQLSL